MMYIVHFDKVEVHRDVVNVVMVLAAPVVYYQF